jgi:integrase
MFILSIITGLRAVDIARLKLTDINWRIGEIRVLQQKNGKPLALPLTTDVAIALKDYILNARLSPTRIMNSNYDEVFLSLKAPCKPLLNGSSIKYVYQQYRSKANLKSGSFHDLRRAVGKNMVTAGVSVDMTAQVLGITDLDTTKQYISLDSKHLKECALDFNGIAPKGGASA